MVLLVLQQNFFQRKKQEVPVKEHVYLKEVLLQQTIIGHIMIYLDVVEVEQVEYVVY